ncbi:MAG: transcription-repair coupling factor [Oscillospiraceae bacterium]|nr:transcription-repair coupling factor [Oscillospiraceae bacterium]
MSCFSNILKNAAETQTILSAITKTRLPMGVLGLSHIHKAHLTASLCELLGRKALLIAPDEAQASRLAEDMRALGADAFLYPARDFVFRTAESRSREYEHLRLNVLSRMADGRYDAVVCSVEAALQLTLPPDELKKRGFTLRAGGDIPMNELKSRLVNAGYVSSGQVDGPGQMSSRGGIIDFFPPNSALPCRCELWGDTVDSLAFFETESQRRLENINEITVTPANEIIVSGGEAFSDTLEAFAAGLRGKGAVNAKALIKNDIEQLSAGVRLASVDKYLPLIYDKPASVFDYAEGAMLLVSESFSVRERAGACHQLLLEEMRSLLEEGVLCRGLDRYTLTWAELLSRYEKLGAVYLDNLPRGSFDTGVRELVTMNARQSSAWNGSYAGLVQDIAPAYEKRGTIVVMSGAEKTARALAEDLRNDSYNSMYFPAFPKEFLPGAVNVLPGSLSMGMDYPGEKFTLITYGSRYSQPVKSAQSKKDAKNAFNSLEELHRGDYIVHNAHGIGIFDGIQKLEAGGAVKDYIKIKYDKSDVLYVPVTQLDQVSRYIGPKSGPDQTVRLNRLGGKEWQKTRSKVKAAVKDMAKELIELYSKRRQIQGFAFSPDIDMQNDFERRFEFEETADQLRCIDELKSDMEKPYPMDRLLCGDVGFGKTEVALRGAFKCASDGKQCAILVPTTILALQHYQTIKKRFEGFPVETEMLSRFCSPKQIADTLKKLRRGGVDIVVGTHRLISKDVEFRDLGLIIVDEEQRFGVAQKERLKELFPAVDVLTLTATPIPRTLNMAMTGIRDMSALEEAPRDRSPVQTYVMEHNLDVLAAAMSAELRRGGQVYYLHNRVETIEKTAFRVKESLPDANVGIAHGKMSEDELSDVWRKLLEGEIDVLVCTTIIETGVDVPNVNTLIIEDADKLGLAQLHQIRGRVGRSSRRASAYLTFTRGKQLTEIAGRRLDAIREFTEFGSGFKIAMRDLEIRGAGNILGAQQHGHMEAVGYELYLRLLAQAVSEEKGETEEKPERECLIDLPIDAHIPPDYIESVPQKLAMYRRIADIRSREDADDVLDELIDRFGEPPACVRGLLTVSLLRGTAMTHGVYEIGEVSGKLRLYIDELNMEKITRLARMMPGRVLVSAAVKPHISIKIAQGEERLDTLRKAFAVMEASDKQQGGQTC